MFAWRIRSCDIVTPVAVLVSTSQIAHSIRDGGDGSLLHKSNTSLKPAAPLATSSESAAAVASSSKASARPLHLCAPDAHPEVTNRLLAFIGVPIPTVAAASPIASAAPVSVASPNDPPPPSSPPRQRQPSTPMCHAADAAVPSPGHELGVHVADFSQRVLPFLQRQQLLQEQRRQCVQDSIFFISLIEAATFLKHVVILSAFLTSCCLVPWRLPTITRLVFKTNDTIKRFQALNACRLMSLVAAQRPEMLATSVQRMHVGILNIASDMVMDDLQRLASHVTGSGRVQSVYEGLMSQVRGVLKKTDAEGHDAAACLVKAHDDSMRLLQLHSLHYVHVLHDLTLAAKRSAKAEEVSAESRAILRALARSGAELRAIPRPLEAAQTLGQAVHNDERHGPGQAGATALVLDDASLNHIDQQARVAVIVAAHFDQSEAEFSAALQKLRDREQQLQVCFADAFCNILQLTLFRLMFCRQNGRCHT